MHMLWVRAIIIFENKILVTLYIRFRKIKYSFFLNKSINVLKLFKILKPNLT